MHNYTSYTEITKAVLDSLQVDDLVKVNDWIKPMRIKGVTENYAVMVQKQFGKVFYSDIEKKPWPGIKHNAMTGGCFHCGPDDWIFGDSDFGYKFDDAEAVTAYLQKFEDGVNHLSVRRGIPILSLQIKKEAGA